MFSSSIDFPTFLCLEINLKERVEIAPITAVVIICGGNGVIFNFCEPRLWCEMKKVGQTWLHFFNWMPPSLPPPPSIRIYLYKIVLKVKYPCGWKKNVILIKSVYVVWLCELSLLSGLRVWWLFNRVNIMWISKQQCYPNMRYGSNFMQNLTHLFTLIPVRNGYTSSSNPFKAVFLGYERHELVEWFDRKPYWYLKIMTSISK